MLGEANKNQRNLLEIGLELDNRPRQRSKPDQKKKKRIFESLNV